MKWKEMKKREIINVSTGDRLGLMGNCDIEFNPIDGRIKSILIPKSKNYLSMISEKNILSVPWGKVKIIGTDMILIENE